MTYLAGAFAFEGSHDPLVFEEITSAIAKHMTKSSGTSVEIRAPGIRLVKTDLGLLRGPAVFEAGDGTCAAACGDPLLAIEGGGVSTRQQSLERIARDTSLLARCRGMFSLCIYDPRDKTLTLATDKLGARTLHYCVVGGILVFASSIRCIESLPHIARVLDLTSVAESVTFGYPLENRTAYEGVKVLGAGERLRCSARGGVEIARYFRLDRVARTQFGSAELAERAYAKFVDAVAIRSDGTSDLLVPLSGGLDSRCVAFALRDLGKVVRSVTFRTPGFVDGEYGDAVAASLGTLHRTLSVPPNEPIAHTLRTVRDLDWGDAFRPGRIFTGDGGSVGMGFVYVEPELAEKLEDGRLLDVAKRLIDRNRLPSRFFHGDFGQHLEGLVLHSVQRELLRIHASDALRKLHLYFMANDQRRHLHDLFENMYGYRLEPQTPFMDSEFLELLIGADARQFLRHGFYHEWIGKFGPEFHSVPWQTYPGHLPCPVQGVTSDRGQWDVRGSEHFATSRRAALQCAKKVLSRAFPRSMKRGHVLLATVLHLSKLRDFAYVLRICNQLAAIQHRAGVELRLDGVVSRAGSDRPRSLPLIGRAGSPSRHGASARASGRVSWNSPAIARPSPGFAGLDEIRRFA